MSAYFYSRPCGRGDQSPCCFRSKSIYFYSRPCGRGDSCASESSCSILISTHAPAGGATPRDLWEFTGLREFLLTPLREGRPAQRCKRACKRQRISTHAPAGGATRASWSSWKSSINFYSRPCGRGDHRFQPPLSFSPVYFYSRPCGRGDRQQRQEFRRRCNFYSRPCGRGDTVKPLQARRRLYFYSRPCGRGDPIPATLPP